jgi:ribosome-interacting GTPase 1
MRLGIDILMDKIWEQLGLVRVYTKRRGEQPDFKEPLILTAGRDGLTVKSAVMQIHRSLLEDFSHAAVWGRSVKFSPQKVGLSAVLYDEDVIQIFKKVSKKSEGNFNAISKKNEKKQAEKEQKEKEGKK